MRFLRAFAPLRETNPSGIASKARAFSILAINHWPALNQPPTQVNAKRHEHYETIGSSQHHFCGHRDGGPEPRYLNPEKPDHEGGSQNIKKREYNSTAKEITEHPTPRAFQARAINRDLPFGHAWMMAATPSTSNATPYRNAAD